MKVDKLLSKLSAESSNLAEVIAPVLNKEGKVRVVIGSHPYTFSVKVNTPGWYIIKPRSSVQAEAVREAQPFEIKQCYQVAPRFRAISVRRLASNSWLVFPFNMSDARSRGFEVKPQPCHLVDRNLTPFMPIVSRLWFNVLLFDSSRVSAPREYLNSLERGEPEPPKVRGRGPEFEIVYSMLSEEIKEAQKKTVQGRIRSAVEYLGGEFIGFTEQGEGYTVHWTDGEHTYSSRIDANMRLVSAGICLEGQEYEQTMASTVAVMRRFRDERDYD